MAKVFTTNLPTVSVGDIYQATSHNNIVTTLNTHSIPPTACANHSATQSIATSTFTALAFNTEPAGVGGAYWDTDTIHDPTTNNTRFQVTTAGLYLCSATISWAANATGSRHLYIRTSGTDYRAGQQTMNCGAEGVVMTVSSLVVFPSATYVEFVAFQSSGGALNVQADNNGGGTFCRGAVVRLGQVT